MARCQFILPCSAKAGTLTGANAGGYDVGVFKLNSAAVQQWVVQRGSAGTDQAGLMGVFTG